MSEDQRRARDLGLLDALDALPREPVEAEVWRLVRAGRDPALGSPSHSRWCDGTFDALYTSFERDGAIAEIHALLSLQPVFPSKDQWLVHRLRVEAGQILHLPDLATLSRLGVDTARYAERDYTRTQAIAEAADFLGYGGIVAPSARWSCLNFIVFTERTAPGQIEVVEVGRPVRWEDWRKRTQR